MRTNYFIFVFIIFFFRLFNRTELCCSYYIITLFISFIVIIIHNSESFKISNQNKRQRSMLRLVSYCSQKKIVTVLYPCRAVCCIVTLSYLYTAQCGMTITMPAWLCSIIVIIWCFCCCWCFLLFEVTKTITHKYVMGCCCFCLLSLKTYMNE